MVAKRKNYDNFLNQITSAGFKHFKTKKNEGVVSDFYKSEEITLIITALNVTEQDQFFAIHVCTNEDYRKTYRE